MGGLGGHLGCPGSGGLLLHLLLHLLLPRRSPGWLAVRVALPAGLRLGEASHLQAGGCLQELRQLAVLHVNLAPVHVGQQQLEVARLHVLQVDDGVVLGGGQRLGEQILAL